MTKIIDRLTKAVKGRAYRAYLINYVDDVAFINDVFHNSFHEALATVDELTSYCIEVEMTVLDSFPEDAGHCTIAITADDYRYQLSVIPEEWASRYLPKGTEDNLREVAANCGWSISEETTRTFPEWREFCADWGADDPDEEEEEGVLVFRKNGIALALSDRGCTGDYYDAWNIDKDPFERLYFNMFGGGIANTGKLRMGEEVIDAPDGWIDDAEKITIRLLRSGVVVQVLTSNLEQLGEEGVEWSQVTAAMLRAELGLIKEFRTLNAL